MIILHLYRFTNQDIILFGRSSVYLQTMIFFGFAAQSNRMFPIFQFASLDATGSLPGAPNGSVP